MLKVLDKFKWPSLKVVDKNKQAQQAAAIKVVTNPYVNRPKTVSQMIQPSATIQQPVPTAAIQPASQVSTIQKSVAPKQSSVIGGLLNKAKGVKLPFYASFSKERQAEMSRQYDAAMQAERQKQTQTGDITPKVTTDTTQKQLGVIQQQVTGTPQRQQVVKQPSVNDTQLKVLQSKYLSTLQPTEEELRLQKQINALISSRDLGITALEGQGRGIPLGLIEGQQQKLMEQAALQAAPLQRQLALLQAQRQAQREAVETQLQFEQNKLKQEQVSPVALSKGQVLVNPQTGEVVYAAPETQTIQSPEDVDAMAKNIIDGFASVSNVPLDYRDEVNRRIRELREEDYKPQWQTKRLSEKQLNNLNDFDNTLASWSNIKQMAEILKEKLGPTHISAYSGTIGDLFAQYSDDPLFSAFKAEVDKAFQLYRKATTGAQASDKELRMLRPLLPKPTDRPQVFFEKLAKTIEGTQRARSIFLKTLKKGGYDVNEFTDTGTDKLPIPEDEMRKLRELNPDATDEEILDALGFSMVGGDTNKAVKVKIGKGLAVKNNNPANLKYAGQKGAVKGIKGFAKFKTPEEGYRALIDQIKLDTNRGHTLASFIYKFAPSTENNTELYIKQMENWLGVNRNTKLKDIDTNKLAQAIAYKESNTKVYA